MHCQALAVKGDKQVVRRRARRTWRIRSGRITASLIGDVLKTSTDQPSSSLLKRICDPFKNMVNTEATRWGKKMESVAFQKAETYFKQSYDGTIQKCGLKLSNTHSYNIGASADGLVCCPT